MKLDEKIRLFKERFGTEPRVFRAPGRINIIGEHTDYNNGFVMPAAVDRQIFLLINKNDLGVFRICSVDRNQEVSFRINEYPKSKKDWPDYIIGIIDQIFRKGHAISGFDLIFGGDIPIGAGMSSSAALSCGTAIAINELFNIGLTRKEMARMAQITEQQYVGLNCGIMDQFACLFSKADHSIKLDCRDLSFEYEPLSLSGLQLILVNSMVSHSLASSEYNLRRQQCEAVVEKAMNKGVSANSLRDISREQLFKLKNEISGVQFKRAAFVLYENDRVLKAKEAMENGNSAKLGQLLNASHNGLSHEYEVSCEQLDFLQEIAMSTQGVLGSRMMGGGFGGCTLNLIESKSSDSFLEKINHSYHKKYGIHPETYKVKTADGASEIDI